MKKPYPDQVEDYFLTRETFTLAQDKNHGFLKTIPQPKREVVGKYYDSKQYLSHDDSGSSLFARVYRWVKKQNLRSKKQLLKKEHPQAKSVLDIGCGTGDFIASLQPQFQVTGMEVDKGAAQIARSKNLNIVNSLEQIQSSYDIITLWHVLEHIHDLDSTISFLKQHLNPGGVLIIALPNYRSYDAQHYKQYWAGYDVPRHLWHFDKPSVVSLMALHKFKVVKFLPMYWDAYYVSLLSEQYKGNKWSPLFAFITGTVSNLKSLGTGEPSSIIYSIRHENKFKAF